MAIPVGIDLGTTYTVVATIQDGRPTVVPNDRGLSLTPSVVYFPQHGGEPLVGEPAQRLARACPERAVRSIKRLMGSGAQVAVAGREFTPAEISGLILQKARADAEAHLGQRVDRAVITVPAYFDDRQRQATRQAALLAGIEPVRLLSEPTAAALAYGLLRESVRTVMVWDLGGGTFDVSILELGEGIFEVRSVSGDTWLGGDDFDGAVAEHLAREYQRATGAEFPRDPGARYRLRDAAEQARIALSSSHRAEVHLPLPGATDPGAVVAVLGRDQMEGLLAGLLGRLAAPTQRALEDAGLLPRDIDRLLLVGGATRTPAVRDMARRLLGKEPYRALDPQRVVAMGAAIQAGMLMGVVERVVLLDVLPLSLGIETWGGIFTKLIPRNSPLPASAAQVFTTAQDYQTSVDLHVLQGERALAVDALSLGQFRLSGIPATPGGIPRVEVVLEADVDGIVHVSAQDLFTQNEVRVAVASSKQLDSEEVDLYREKALEHASQDSERRERIAVSLEARNTIAAAEMALGHMADTSMGVHVQGLMAGVERVRAALARGTVEEVRDHCAELRRLLAALPADGREQPPGTGSPSSFQTMQYPAGGDPTGDQYYSARDGRCRHGEP